MKASKTKFHPGQVVVFRITPFASPWIGVVERRELTDDRGDGWVVRSGQDKRCYLLVDGQGTMRPATKGDEKYFQERSKPYVPTPCSKRGSRFKVLPQTGDVDEFDDDFVKVPNDEPTPKKFGESLSKKIQEELEDA